MNGKKARALRKALGLKSQNQMDAEERNRFRLAKRLYDKLPPGAKPEYMAGLTRVSGQLAEMKELIAQEKAARLAEAAAEKPAISP